MRKLIKLSALSLSLALGALSLTAPKAFAAKAAWCDGGGCCADTPVFPGYTCSLGSFHCERGANYCIEECSWNCIQN